MNTIRLMLRGVQCGPWPIQARLDMLGLRYSLQMKERDSDLCHIAVVELLGFGDVDIRDALADPDSRALDALVAFVRFAIGEGEGELLICPPDADDVQATGQLTPGALKVALPRLLSSPGTLVFLDKERTGLRA